MEMWVWMGGGSAFIHSFAASTGPAGPSASVRCPRRPGVCTGECLPCKLRVAAFCTLAARSLSLGSGKLRKDRRSEWHGTIRRDGTGQGASRLPQSTTQASGRLESPLGRILMGRSDRNPWEWAATPALSCVRLQLCMRPNIELGRG